MKHLVEFDLKDGSSTIIEVEDLPTQSGAVKASLVDGVVAKAEDTFETAIERIKPAAATVMAALRELNEPDEIGLEFAIKLSAKAGAVIASADSEANFKVTLSWKKPEGKK